jgi:hypothetical protein
VLGIKKRKLQDAWYWDRPNLAKQLVQDGQPSNFGQVGQLDGQDAPGEAPGLGTDADDSEVF